MPIDAIQSAIRGPVGESDALTVARPPDFNPIQFNVKRAEIAIPSVIWHLDPGESKLGVMEINLIAASTADEILRAVKDLQNRGASHFILDLRNNPGGLLTAGVDISRLFLKDGMVIEQQYRGQPVESFKVEQPGPLVDLNLAILINRGSASAAEIIAGSLQAHHRALLIGSPSYGKDTIQLVFDLQDGSSLHVTAAQWWIPGLVNPISGVGLQPDVLVEAAEPNAAAGGPDPLIQAAIQELFGVQ
jgi:carboxyl-terminal processing protease